MSGCRAGVWAYMDARFVCSTDLMSHFLCRNIHVITLRASPFPGPRLLRYATGDFFEFPHSSERKKEKEERKEGKEGVSDGLGWFNPDPGSRGRSGQPEVFRFYSGRDLGIRKAGEKEKKKKKKKHEHRAGETGRGNDEAGADPFLQASNLVADIMQNGLPHAHANLKTDTCRQTPADKDMRRHARTPEVCSSPIPCDVVECCLSVPSTAPTGLGRHWKNITF